MINSFAASNGCTGSGNAAAVCDYGAACGNSFPGNGQFWGNMLEFGTTADTKPKSIGPLYRGSTGFTTGGDPSFTGNAGQKGACWAMNTGTPTYFTGSGQQTSDPKSGVGGFAANWHQTGSNKQPATVVITMEYHAIAAFQSLFTTKFTGSSIGLNGYINSAGKVGMTQQGDTGSVSILGTTVMTDARPYVVAIGWNGASVQGVWVGSPTGQAGTATFNGSSTNASSPLLFGLSFDSTYATPAFGFQSGTKIYDIQLYNKLLSNSEMAVIIAALEDRNGIDFTP